MGIDGLNNLYSKSKYEINFLKENIGQSNYSMPIGSFCNTIACSGTPSAGKKFSNFPVTAFSPVGNNGEAFSKTSQGAIYFPDPPVGKNIYLSSVEFNCGYDQTTATFQQVYSGGTIYIYDLLWMNAYETSTFGPQWGLRYWTPTPFTRYTDGKNLQALIGFDYVSSWSISTYPFILNYNNQDNIVKNSLNNLAVNNAVNTPDGYSFFITLDSGDYGIQKINSIAPQFGVSGTRGGLYIVKPIAIIPVNSGKTKYDFLDISMPKIDSNACLNIIFQPNRARYAGYVSGKLTLLYG